MGNGIGGTPIVPAPDPAPAPAPYVGQLWTFNSSGTFTAQTTGNIQVVVVGGGGGGRAAGNGTGGGGGGVTYSTAVPVISGTSYTVTVGSGGALGPGASGNPGTQGGNSSFVGTNVNLVSLGGNGGVSTNLGGGGGGAGANSGQPIQVQTPPVDSGTTFVYGFVTSSRSGGGAGGGGGGSATYLGGPGVTLPSNFGSIIVGGGGGGGNTGGGFAPGGGGYQSSYNGVANSGGGGSSYGNGGPGIVLVYDGPVAAIPITGPPVPGTLATSTSLFSASASATQTYRFVPPYTGNIQVLVAGGGYPGGSAGPNGYSTRIAGGGGGSGGGVICTNYPITFGVPIQFTVGTVASPSTFGLITANAGGIAGNGGGRADGQTGGSSGGAVATGVNAPVSSGPATKGSAPAALSPSCSFYGEKGGICPAAVSQAAISSDSGGGGGGGWGSVGGNAPGSGTNGGTAVTAPATFNSVSYGAGGAGGKTDNSPIAPVTIIGSGGNGCPALTPVLYGGAGTAGDVRIYF